MTSKTPKTAPPLGSHRSIAGGYDQAVRRAGEIGCACVQIFTKNNNQWRGKPITDEDARKFAEALKQWKIGHPLAHDSYLINLASPDRNLWKKSVDAFVDELHRAGRLGIPYVVTHPGSMISGDERDGLRRVISALDEVFSQVPEVPAQCLLETTAGQGTALGWRFEQLAEILDGVKRPERLGVCFDTCHVFAAGYPLAPEKDYRATLRAFDRLIGLKRIKAFHLNDSRRERGSRVDRHDHVGRGKLGLEPFRLLLNDSRFQKIPMYLETPKEFENGVDMDVVNLKLLQGLIGEKRTKV
ncbi:MAG: deoxyribonuclease IV [Pirellulales bacterium]|nr:deoxyribonuclease IV [Pirellulales bacterium]